MERGKKYKLDVDVGNKIFHYSGILIDETKEFFTIDEVQKGKLSISKNKIITITEVPNE